MLKVNQLIGFGSVRASGGSVDSNLVWVCGGSNGATLLTACQTYNLGSGAVASAATLGTARMAGMGGTDNTSKAVISHGYNIQTGLGYTNTTEKISLPSGAWASSATVANQSGRMGGGCTTGTHLFGTLSDNPADNNTSNKTEKYNFSADTTAAGGTASYSAILRSGSHGTAATSYSCGGSAGLTNVSVYTHSSDTSAAGTAIAGNQAGYAGGSSTHMYVGNHVGASFTAMRKYTMATQTDAAGTALSQTMGHYEGVGSNSAKMLVTGGNTGSGTATVIYTFSGDTTANGTAITAAYRWPVCFGEMPGGIN